MTDTRRPGGSRVRSAACSIALVGLAAIFPPSGAEVRAQQAHAGKAPYDKWCAGCHGDSGAGDGAAGGYMLPRPRDFTKGLYQVRSTASGELPTDADIRRIIDDGMPGTAMPGWREKLSDRERADLVAYLKTFSSFFANANPTSIDVGGAPGGGDDAIAEGARVFQTLECFKCHGQQGRGDGSSAPTLTDDWGQPIRAADLSRSWRFNGGATVEEIYTRLMTGLNGTPMPSYVDAVSNNLVTDEQIWRVAQYVRSLSPDDPPEIREVVRAVRATGTLPVTLDDSAWSRADETYIPLVGQIIVKPRWFAPMVDGVWVQAMHDGERLALRLRWHDPSRSPDPAWGEWHGRMQTAMENMDSTAFAPHGPDRMTVQFPMSLVDGQRPYFLGGDARRPAHLWRWTSAPDGIEEARGTGLGTATPRAGASTLTHVARFADGEWQLLVTRALASSDSAAAPTFPVGRAIPIAFFAADGSNGEDAIRTSVSAWYALYLDVPTPPRVYATPILAMALTAGLGALAVRNAQRRRREPERPTSEEQ
jgi:DMSO reductase family type II enzyme heme b subunit